MSSHRGASSVAQRLSFGQWWVPFGASWNWMFKMGQLIDSSQRYLWSLPATETLLLKPSTSSQDTELFWSWVECFLNRHWNAIAKAWVNHTWFNYRLINWWWAFISLTYADWTWTNTCSISFAEYLRVSLHTESLLSFIFEQYCYIHTWYQ